MARVANANIEGADKHIKTVLSPGRRDPFSGYIINAQYDERDLGLMMVSFLVPGRKTYLLSYAFESAVRPEHEATMNELAASFHLLERPSVYEAFGGFLGSIPGDAILGLLVGLTVFAYKMLGI